MTNEDFHKQNTLPGVNPEERLSVPFEIPKTIGPYKIESLLEKGGMSYVYLGTHPETKDPVTIKVLSPKYLSHPEIVQRFLNEAEIIALADHPNIVKMYGHGDWEGGMYIAMEFVQGVSLRQYLQHNPISLKRALEMILETAYALCHLHTHGIIHRDLKLENILITESGSIKVIDFGIAQLLTEKSDESPFPKQRLIGTPIYMSPEQRENPESVSYPSDIYSLGIIAYELVLGKLSHGRIHLSLMPKGLQKILAKALQPRPEDRYQDVVDFITDISAYLNSATLLKEKKESDQLSELSEHLQQAQMSLVPHVSPKWHNIEMGLMYHKGIQATGMYYDFFALPNDIYGVIMVEPAVKSAEGMVYTAVLRGMIKALSKLTKNTFELVSLLNELLTHDSLNQIFTLNYLLLSPNDHTFHYISCGYGNLWHFPMGQDIPKKYSSENVALGIDRHAEFQEISQSWNVGDTLFLSSFSVLEETEKSGNKLFSEDQFKQALIDNLYLPPQKQVEAIFRKAKIAAGKTIEENSHAIISIHRIE